MRLERVYWASYAVLAVGMGLCIVLTMATPARLAYDDHFTPIEIMVREHRPPLPEECWECYQPPLYYAVASLAYGMTESTAKLVGTTPTQATAAAKKVVQCTSTAAGSITLLLCLLILRVPTRRPPGIEAMSLASVALLPRHIYMSAMVTNDALTYLVASLAVYVFLRTSVRNWPLVGCMLVGGLAGLAILCKAYSMMTAGALLCTAMLSRRRESDASKPRRKGERTMPQPQHRRMLGPVLAIAIPCLALGIWPTVRNLAHYNKPHVDNFDFFQTAMQSQFPGSRDQIDFTTFRIVSLLDRPWVHLSHVNSFWTELYARYWFDYEGLNISLAVSNEWRGFVRSLRLTGSQRTREDWKRVLAWSEKDVPRTLRIGAIASYCAGIPITAAILISLFHSLRRLRECSSTCLHTLNPLASLFVPIFQVLRLPFMSAMKAAFTLNAVSSAPWLLATAVESLPAKLRHIVICLICLSLLTLLAANINFIVYMFQHAA
ncbi:MAG: glycosyltransferase family 39 protein [Planctomycetota bacterium]